MGKSLAEITKAALHRAGISIPEHYVCVDIETTGLKFHKAEVNNDLVVQVAWLECVGGTCRNRFSQMCNWVAAYDAGTMEWAKQDLQRRLDAMRAQMREKNETYSIQLVDILTEPCSAIETLTRYIDQLLLFHWSGIPLCGLHLFDVILPALEAVMDEYLVLERPRLRRAWNYRLLLDLEAIYKIAVGPIPRRPHESVTAYLYRAKKTAIDKSWNMRTLIEEYGIDQAARELIPRLHRSDADCEVMHLIMEAIRGAKCKCPVRSLPGGTVPWNE